MADVEKVLGRLDITSDERRGAMAFVAGRAEQLPWASPPRWKEGQSPVRRHGREEGSKVVRGRLVRPGEDPPPPPNIDWSGAMIAIEAVAEKFANGLLDRDGLRRALRASIGGALASAGFVAIAGGDIWELLNRGAL